MIKLIVLVILWTPAYLTVRLWHLGLSTEVSRQARCVGSSKGERTQAGRLLLLPQLLVLLISTTTASVALVGLSQPETD